MTTPRTDMHAHVFNLRYLPLEGILRRYNVPPIVAKALAKLLNSVTRDASDDSALYVPADRSGLLAIESLAMRTQPQMLDDPDVRAALAQVRQLTGAEFAASLGEQIASSAAVGVFQELYGELAKATPDRVFEGAAGFIAWLHFLSHSEEEILGALLDTFPEVDLFVHHMMDLEAYYHPGACRYDFVSEQIARMRQLVEKSNGRLMSFVAWSPRRVHDISIVRRALEDGFAGGVKFYPPSGYRPDDQLHNDLYDLCNERWPIFAHCTPRGFEAYDCSGLNSDPKYWATVLAERPTLRVCLAHAGGEAEWFGAKPWAGSFAAGCVELAVNRANVYLEFGYHDYVLDATRRRQFVTILAGLLGLHGDRLGKKIVYGTDWHMIERLKGHEKYLIDFDEAFSKEPALAKYKEDFFYNNGVRFLNLPNYLGTRASSRRGDSHDSVAAHLEKVLTRVQGLGKS